MQAGSASRMWAWWRSATASIARAIWRGPARSGCRSRCTSARRRCCASCAAPRVWKASRRNTARRRVEPRWRCPRRRCSASYVLPYVPQRSFIACNTALLPGAPFIGRHAEPPAEVEADDATLDADRFASAPSCACSKCSTA
ncbi:hypothetical protein PT2222_160217 [Paraburkholderia tropica]